MRRIEPACTWNTPSLPTKKAREAIPTQEPLESGDRVSLVGFQIHIRLQSIARSRGSLVIESCKTGFVEPLRSCERLSFRHRRVAGETSWREAGFADFDDDMMLGAREFDGMNRGRHPAEDHDGFLGER
jgi:hypothetical protein